MWRYLAIGCAVVCVGLAVALWWVERDRGVLRADLIAVSASLASTKVALAQAEETAAVHREYLAKAKVERDELNELRNEILLMEGGDAPLSDYLRGVAERVYGSRN